MGKIRGYFVNIRKRCFLHTYVCNYCITSLVVTFAWLLQRVQALSQVSISRNSAASASTLSPSSAKYLSMLRNAMPWNRSNHNVVGLLIRQFATKPKPKMKPIELNTPPEQTQTITRVIFDVLKEHGPLTIAETWDRVKEVGLRGLTSKRHMKIILRWMRERQKLKLICNHVGPHKQFLYTTWFTKHNPSKFSKPPENLTGKSSGHPKLP